MLEYVIFGIARLAHSGANTISDIVETALLQIGIVGVFCEGSEICYVLKG